MSTVTDEDTRTLKPRPVTNFFRMLVLGPLTAICFVVFLILYPLASHTSWWFAWTTLSPMSAATMGAGFLAATLLFGSALSEERWADVRLAALAPLPLMVMTCVAAYLHLDRLHLHWGDELFGMVVAAIWVVAFTGLPFVLVIGWIGQAVLGKGSPALRAVPFPHWARHLIEFLASSLIFIGVVFFIAPTSFIAWWPWRVDELDMRAQCAWAVTFGFAAWVATWEDDLDRIRSGLLAFLAFGFAETINIARFSGEINWHHPSGWIFVVLSTATAVAGIVGFMLAGRPRLVEAEPEVASLDLT